MKRKAKQKKKTSHLNESSNSAETVCCDADPFHNQPFADVIVSQRMGHVSSSTITTDYDTQGTHRVETSLSTQTSPSSLSTVHTTVPPSRHRGRRGRVKHSMDPIELAGGVVSTDMKATESELENQHALPSHATRSAQSHDPLVTSTPCVEPRLAIEKTDTVALHHLQRKMNKRELKALLKQAKKNRSVLDDEFLAVMDELAVFLSKSCMIDLDPSPCKPIRIASPPTSTVSDPISPIRKGVGGRRGGRRGGRGARRGASAAAKLGPVPSASPASWVPLILPYATASRSGEHDESPDRWKSFLPWLNQLSETRVNRFLTGIRTALSHCRESKPSPVFASEQLTGKPIVDGSVLSRLAAGESVQSYHSMTLSAHSVPSMGAISVMARNQKHKLPQLPVADGLWPVHRIPSPTTVQQSFSDVMTTLSEVTTNTITPENGSLSSVTLNSAVPPPPLRHFRGRGRGRRSRGFRSSSKLIPSTTVHSGVDPASSVLQGHNPISNKIVLNYSGFPPKTKSKPKVSRELRGLVTWDAVKAQQQQQKLLTNSSESVESLSTTGIKPVDALAHPTDASLAIAHNFLAAAAIESADGNSVRIRRTRQSSGGVDAVYNLPNSDMAFTLATGAASTSTTTTTITAVSVEAPYSETASFRQKQCELSSLTAVSGLSTASSSITSEPVLGSRVHELDSTSEHPIASNAVSPPSFPTHAKHSVLESPYGVSQMSISQPASVSHSMGSIRVDKESSITSSCANRYSPISVDQESTGPLGNTSPNTNDTLSSVETARKRLASTVTSTISATRRAKRSRQESLAVVTSLISSSSTIDSIVPASADPSGRCRRRRQPIAISLPASTSMILTQEITASSTPSTESPGIDVTSEPFVVTTCSSTSLIHPSGSLRRSNVARSSVLPPRKRYKAGIDSASSALTPSSLSAISESTAVTCSHSTSTVSTTITSSISSIGFPTSFSISSLTGNNESTGAAFEPVRKRGRGRPARRGRGSRGTVYSHYHHSSTDSIHPFANTNTYAESVSGFTTASMMDSTLASSPDDNSFLDRPKREAAALGYASLVAANLNNSLLTTSAANNQDFPVHGRNSSSNTPHSLESAAAPLSSVTTPLSSIQGQMQVTVSPARGRGRPPRPKPDPIAISVDSDIPSTGPTSHGDPSIRAEQHATAPSSIAESNAEGTTQLTDDTPMAQVELVHPSPVGVSGRGRRRRGRGSSHIVVVDPILISDDLADLPGIPPDYPVSYATVPRSRKLPGRSKSTTSTTSFERKAKLTVDDDINVTKIADIVQDRTDISSLDDSSTVTRLPCRSSLFNGSLLSTSIPFGPNGELSDTSSETISTVGGPLCDILLKLLNEPDPNEPEYRLCAPVVYLPSPKTCVEFYRFVISSYASTGTSFRARFTRAFIERLFGTRSPQSTTTTDAEKSQESLFGVEFPSLCLASVAQRLILTNQRGSGSTNESIEQLGQDLCLSIPDRTMLALDCSDTENMLPLLDAAIEGVFAVWESYAGRRSWLGRRLIRMRAFYTSLRADCVRTFTTKYDVRIPPLKATALLNMPVCRVLGPGTKKKADRRALERGAEVIRCLCGFRVEGGHVMVQCDRCAAWQHLPCLWWALNRAIVDRTDSQTSMVHLCKTALVAAQAVGSGYLAELIGQPTDRSNKDDTDADLPYFCPACLGLDKLTLEYPRSLSAAMAMNDLDSVFSLQETTVEGEHEFWSLASVTEGEQQQIRTDDYAFINRIWLTVRPSSGRARLCDPACHVQLKEAVETANSNPITCAYDRVIIRIYRLWKDCNGDAWIEGGPFLRPYDLPGQMDSTEPVRLWHYREVVYDEATRLVLPLSAWIGRCVVLCPSAYRTGRPADLLSPVEVQENFLGLLPIASDEQHQQDQVTCRSKASSDRLFFVCDKLVERTAPVDTNSTHSTYRFDEISPGYLKVNMRPYCFLRKPDVTVGGTRSTLDRQHSAVNLLEMDQIQSVDASPVCTSELETALNPPRVETPTIPDIVATIGNNLSSTSSVVTTVASECTGQSSTDDIAVSNVNSSAASVRQKGEKLARLVDWLERKRHSEAKNEEPKPVNNSLVNEDQMTDDQSLINTSVPPTPGPSASPSYVHASSTESSAVIPVSTPIVVDSIPTSFVASDLVADNHVSDVTSPDPAFIGPSESVPKPTGGRKKCRGGSRKHALSRSTPTLRFTESEHFTDALPDGESTVTGTFTQSASEPALLTTELNPLLAVEDNDLETLEHKSVIVSLEPSSDLDEVRDTEPLLLPVTSSSGSDIEISKSQDLCDAALSSVDTSSISSPVVVTVPLEEKADTTIAAMTFHQESSVQISEPSPKFLEEPSSSALDIFSRDTEGNTVDTINDCVEVACLQDLPSQMTLSSRKRKRSVTRKHIVPVSSPLIPLGSFEDTAQNTSDNLHPILPVFELISPAHDQHCSPLVDSSQCAVSEALVQTSCVDAQQAPSCLDAGGTVTNVIHIQSTSYVDLVVKDCETSVASDECLLTGSQSEPMSSVPTVDVVYSVASCVDEVETEGMAQSPITSSSSPIQTNSASIEHPSISLIESSAALPIHYALPSPTVPPPSASLQSVECVDSDLTLTSSPVAVSHVSLLETTGGGDVVLKERIDRVCFSSETLPLQAELVTVEADSEIIPESKVPEDCQTPLCNASENDLQKSNTETEPIHLHLDLPDNVASVSVESPPSQTLESDAQQHDALSRVFQVDDVPLTSDDSQSLVENEYVLLPSSTFADDVDVSISTGEKESGEPTVSDFGSTPILDEPSTGASDINQSILDLSNQHLPSSSAILGCTSDLKSPPPPPPDLCPSNDSYESGGELLAQRRRTDHDRSSSESRRHRSSSHHKSRRDTPHNTSNDSTVNRKSTPDHRSRHSDFESDRRDSRVSSHGQHSSTHERHRSNHSRSRDSFSSSSDHVSHWSHNRHDPSRDHHHHWNDRYGSSHHSRDGSRSVSHHSRYHQQRRQHPYQHQSHYHGRSYEKDSQQQKSKGESSSFHHSSKSIR